MFARLDWSAPRWFEIRDHREIMAYHKSLGELQVCEIIVWSRPLTKKEHRQLKNYLNEKYRLTIYHKIKWWFKNLKKEK